MLEGLAARLFTIGGTAAQKAELRRACEIAVRAYEDGNAVKIIEAKNEFYDILFKGAGSKTLFDMIGALHARIWRWRVLGLAHPGRSPQRSMQSVRNLRNLVSAIENGKTYVAERNARDEVTRAEAEATRLVALGECAGRRTPPGR